MKLKKLKGKLITKHLKGKKGIKEIFNIPLNCHSHSEYLENLVRALSDFHPDSSCSVRVGPVLSTSISIFTFYAWDATIELSFTW